MTLKLILLPSLLLKGFLTWRFTSACFSLDFTWQTYTFLHLRVSRDFSQHIDNIPVFWFPFLLWRSEISACHSFEVDLSFSVAAFKIFCCGVSAVSLWCVYVWVSFYFIPQGFWNLGLGFRQFWGSIIFLKYCFWLISLLSGILNRPYVRSFLFIFHAPSLLSSIFHYRDSVSYTLVFCGPSLCLLIIFLDVANLLNLSMEFLFKLFYFSFLEIIFDSFKYWPGHIVESCPFWYFESFLSFFKHITETFLYTVQISEAFRGSDFIFFSLKGPNSVLWLLNENTYSLKFHRIPLGLRLEVRSSREIMYLLLPVAKGHHLLGKTLTILRLRFWDFLGNVNSGWNSLKDYVRIIKSEGRLPFRSCTQHQGLRRAFSLPSPMELCVRGDYF